MRHQTVTKEMTVFEALELVPGAIELFRAHGVNPAGECGPLTREIALGDTPERCHLEDLAELIGELNAALQKNRALLND